MKKLFLFLIPLILLAGCIKKDGVVNELYPNGESKSLAIYKNGKINGMNFEFKEDGKFDKINFYNQGYCDSSYWYDYVGDTIRIARMGGGPHKEMKLFKGKLYSVNIQYLDRVNGDTTYYRFFFKNNIPIREFDTEAMTDSGRVTCLIVNDTVIRTTVYYKSGNSIKTTYCFPEGTIVKDEVWSPGSKPPSREVEERTMEQMRNDLRELDNPKVKGTKTR